MMYVNLLPVVNCFDETCIYSPCANNCKDADDCPGVDCGCDKSKESCVNCEAYSCKKENCALMDVYVKKMVHVEEILVIILTALMIRIVV